MSERSVGRPNYAITGIQWTAAPRALVARCQVATAARRTIRRRAGAAVFDNRDAYPPRIAERIIATRKAGNRGNRSPGYARHWHHLPRRGAAPEIQHIGFLIGFNFFHGITSLSHPIVPYEKWQVKPEFTLFATPGREGKDLGSRDFASGDDDVAVVENGELAGGDGAHRLFENRADAVPADFA